MPATRYKLLRILAGLFIFLLGCPPPSQPPREAILTGIATIGQAGFTILGQVFVLTPNSTGSFLLQVRDPETGDVVPNGSVTVSLNDPEGDSQRVFEGTTDDQGLVQVSFTVPENVGNPNQVLVVESQSTAGTAKFEESVYVGRAYNVLVSTDKPVYQPGQTIHVRALALDTLKLEAANAQELTLIVADPNGNKLARQTLTTSKYGIAAFDFNLDTLATSGDYIITAEIGPVTSSRSVEVKPYTLPRFKVEFDSDRNFYLPGETATGVIDANYFFGKPVNGGQVTIRGFVTDIDRFQVFEITGTTDGNGQYDYSFEIPDYFVGQLENNAAEVDLEISVVDTANHVESIDESITVAEKKLLLEAIPESGNLRAGIENIVYVDATYPDGRAAPSTLQIDSQLLTEPLTLATDAYGLARFTISPELNVPTVITLTATTTPTRNTPEGTTVTQVLTLDADETPTSVLLRPERAEYHIGDTMNLDIHVAGNARTVYLDVIKDSQTFGMVALPVEDNLAQAAIDIDGSLLGTLELNAYVINDQGDIVRDRRLALVNPAPAQVQVSSDAGTYLPGETATVDIQVLRDGSPMVGALGISIVDESVFSVGAQDPGFARTYFLLERELLEPRYEIRDFTDMDDDESSPYDQTPDSVRYGLQTPQPQPNNHLAIAQARNTALMGLFAHELHASSAPASKQATEQATEQATLATDASADQWGWLNRFMLMAPLLGLAFYDGSKSRRRLLIATVLFTLAAGFYAACAPSAAPAASVAGDAAAPSETTATRGDAATPRLRQYFPETLYWMPELETDAEGRAQIALPLADSITTWRVSVIASDEAGNLGSGQGSLRVFQPFFVEPDMPRFLTVGDELDVPVALYNYLDEPQTVELSVKPATWFELRGETTQSVNLSPNEVSVAYIPINVTDFGTQDFEVTAIGNTASDAIVRSVEIIPNGSPQATVVNGQLEAAHSFAVAVPNSAIPGTGRVTVKLYPGIVSQAIDGLSAMLQEPYGCFEQTSSVTYPNVLVLDYLREMEQQSPEIEFRANAYINAGYQRLLTFEVRSTPGGFSLFGDPPPETILTAYGLMEFADMARVHYVDPLLIERTAQFLIDRQQDDGSWNPLYRAISLPGEDDRASFVAATAYTTWALADAGYADEPTVVQALAYIAENIELATDDAYVLALAANAFVAAGQPNNAILDELASRSIDDANQSVRWTSSANTWLHASGLIVGLETTAMAAIAFIRSGEHIDRAEQALRYITNSRDQFGGYGSTQATVMSLKALLLAAQMGGEGGSATVTVSLNGTREQQLTIDDTNGDVVQQVVFDDIGAEASDLIISMEGDRAIQYQVSTEYYQPWTGTSSTPTTPPAPQAVRIDVAYDRTELAVNDIVQVIAEVELLAEGMAGTLIVDLGIPPGFTPLTNDLDALVVDELIDRYELTGRQIILYMTDIPSGQVFSLPYRLQARFPIRAQAPASQVYDYYTPEQQATEPPQRIVVTLGTPN